MNNHEIAECSATVDTVAESSQRRLAAEHREQITVKPIHALVIALNEEPENVMVLPPLDDSLVDKITLVHVNRAGLIGNEGADRIQLMNRIEAEMPAFVALVESFEIPEHLKADRTTIRAYQHPEVLRLLNVLAPEQELADLLAMCPTFRKWKDDPETVTMTAKEVEHSLFDYESTKLQAMRLLAWPAACGVYLGRLADQDRGVKKLKLHHGTQRYEITKFASE